MSKSQLSLVSLGNARGQNFSAASACTQKQEGRRWTTKDTDGHFDEHCFRVCITPGAGNVRAICRVAADLCRQEPSRAANMDKEMSTNITIDRRSVTRLKNEVTINVDRWGVAHIRAENLHDLFFAQGW
ncbi:MAG: penicillin acylase family protein, partial [Mesorhizobium sp.]